MAKRLCAFVVVFVAVFAVTVDADVIWSNDFFEQNKRKTQRLVRQTFIVNSPDGYVILQEKPGEANDSVSRMVKKNLRSKKMVKVTQALPRVKNGKVLVIGSVYVHNGKYWGIPPTDHSHSNPGWVPMDHLLEIYTHAEFEKENKDKFYEYTGSYDAVLSAERLVLWQWPGSDRDKQIIEHKIMFPVPNNRIYRDKEGREWCEAHYHGLRESSFFAGWICISDPENTNIPAFNPSPPPVKWSPNHIRGR